MNALLMLGYWLSLLAVLYPYLGYPLTLWLATRARGAYQPPAPSPSFEPSVTLMISAYNESAVLEAKLDNALALDYPHDKLAIVVVSDASDDGTDEIVLRRAARDPRVQLYRQEERRGKTAGLNRGIELAHSEVVVFSDANAMYEAGAIRELVAPLIEPQIGYVVGAAHYSDTADGESQASEGLYWRYELALKELESGFGSVVGGDGAIYAIRRNLYWPLRDDDINDFVNPLQIITAGYRGVFNARARAYEHGADSFGKEFRRKRRIVNRSWRAVTRYGAPLFRAGNPAFAFQLVAHKILRWFAMPIITALALLNLALVMRGAGWFYVLSFCALLGSAALAGAAQRSIARQQKPARLAYLFYYFYLVNIAAVLGIWDESRGVRHSKWDHVRKSSG